MPAPRFTMFRRRVAPVIGVAAARGVAVAARRAAAVGALVLGLAGCAATGHLFHASALNGMVAGQTTLAQAADKLGAPPENVWHQGNGSVLARWAYRRTAATDAVYFEQELWLRFAADGTLQRVEHEVNIPGLYRPQAPNAQPPASARGNEPDDQPLLPAGTMLTPGTAYPIQPAPLIDADPVAPR